LKENLQNIGLGSDTKSIGNTQKIDKGDYLKLETFCASEYTISGVKGNLGVGESLCKSYIS
jgi:hypothetical protein